VTIRIDHNVIKLQVTVDDSAFVKEQQGANNFGRVEARARLVELARSLDLEHQITAVHVLHDEEQSINGLEARVQLCQEWMLAGKSEHTLLCHGAFHIIILNDDVLLKDLQTRVERESVDLS
jgi:hypothetical protein